MQILVKMVKGFRGSGGQSLPFSIDFGRRPYNTLCDHVLVISRIEKKCIYSNFSPKIGCHGNTFLSLVYRSVKMNSLIAETLSQNQTVH